jgi:ribonuclease HII
MFDFNYFARYSKYENFFIAGCDEVGRGPIAGPVVSACVSIHINRFSKIEIIKFLKQLSLLGVTDSKKIKGKKRKEVIRGFNGLEDYLAGVFTNSSRQKFIYNYSKNIILKISIQHISAQEIDQINILNASLKSMRTASIQVSENLAGTILIDGNRKFKPFRSEVELETIVKGDSKSLIIGLASIIAKECRDEYMKNLSGEFPQYLWDRNAGYPTKDHLEALKNFGITKFHRRTFGGVKELCS